MDSSITVLTTAPSNLTSLSLVVIFPPRYIVPSAVSVIVPSASRSALTLMEPGIAPLISLTSISIKPPTSTFPLNVVHADWPKPPTTLTAPSTCTRSPVSVTSSSNVTVFALSIVRSFKGLIPPTSPCHVISSGAVTSRFLDSPASPSTVSMKSMSPSPLFI